MADDRTCELCGDKVFQPSRRCKRCHRREEPKIRREQKRRREHEAAGPQVRLALDVPLIELAYRIDTSYQTLIDPPNGTQTWAKMQRQLEQSLQQLSLGDSFLSVWQHAHLASAASSAFPTPIAPAAAAATAVRAPAPSQGPTVFPPDSCFLPRPQTGTHRCVMCNDCCRSAANGFGSARPLSSPHCLSVDAGIAHSYSSPHPSARSHPLQGPCCTGCPCPPPPRRPTRS